MARISDEAGFTLVETLVTTAIIGILAITAMPSFIEYRERAYDSIARSDFRNTKTALYADVKHEPDSWHYYYVFSNGSGTANYWTWNGSSFQNGTFTVGDELPEAISHLTFSEGTIPRIVYRYSYPSLDYDYKYAWIDHQKSGYSYRFIDYQSQWTSYYLPDQVIKK